MSNTCGVCKKSFKPKNYWQKYCSNSCKQAGWAVRKLDACDERRKFKFIYKYGQDHSDMLKGYSIEPCDIFQVNIKFCTKTVHRLYSKTKRAIKDGKIFYSDTTPDLDNSVKPVLDSLTGKIWSDDRKVVRLILEKFFAEEKKVEVEVIIL